MNTGHVEQRLRAALSARVDDITAQDLRPAAQPGGATRRADRPRRLLLALALPATLAVVSAVTVGVWAVVGPPRQDEAAVGVDAPPIVVAATVRTATVPGNGASLSYPVFTVSGGSPEVADHVRRLLSSHVDGVIGSYRDRDGLRTLEITVGAIARWNRYLSVRLDQLDDFGGAHGTSGTSAVVVDTATGSPADAASVFTDVDAVDRLMRTALTHQPEIFVDTDAVAQLSMRSGTDDELTWYLAEDGLHWVVDSCTIAGCAAGKPEAVVAWPKLVALVRSTTK